jgi:hypothetical protein
MIDVNDLLKKIAQCNTCKSASERVKRTEELEKQIVSSLNLIEAGVESPKMQTAMMKLLKCTAEVLTINYFRGNDFIQICEKV